MSIISEENYKLRVSNIQMTAYANDYIANHIVIDGFYEKLLLDNTLCFLDTLKENTKNWVFIDIGANIGNHSIYFADYFKEVHAFEPNPTVFRILEINSEYKKNINCYNFGLGDKKGNTQLNIKQENVGSSFIAIDNKNNHNYQESISININKLDNIMGNFSKADLVKIDMKVLKKMF